MLLAKKKKSIQQKRLSSTTPKTYDTSKSERRGRDRDSQIPESNGGRCPSPPTSTGISSHHPAGSGRQVSLPWPVQPHPPRRPSPPIRHFSNHPVPVPRFFAAGGGLRPQAPLERGSNCPRAPGTPTLLSSISSLSASTTMDGRPWVCDAYGLV